MDWHRAIHAPPLNDPVADPGRAMGRSPSHEVNFRGWVDDFYTADVPFMSLLVHMQLTAFAPKPTKKGCGRDDFHQRTIDMQSKTIINAGSRRS
jgi:hypothetical protein